MLAVGDKAPSFVAAGTEGDLDLTAALAKGPLVLFFFPKAFTSGWTVEAVEFNQLLSEFEDMGVGVIGTSVDPVERLQRFRDKHGLRYPLVSDGDRAIGETFGTLKTDKAGSHERDTVLIAGDGTILLAYRKVRAQGHAAEVLAAAKELQERGDI
jgi:thioredoxin-dependent peroxiredoxin